MSATIRIWEVEATIDGYRWSCEDRELAQFLTSLLDPDGPPTEDPAPDVHAAERIAAQLGGEVVRYDVPEHVEGRVY